MSGGEIPLRPTKLEKTYEPFPERKTTLQEASKAKSMTISPELSSRPNVPHLSSITVKTNYRERVKCIYSAGHLMTIM